MKQSHCSPLCLKDKNSESGIVDEVVIAVTLGGTHSNSGWTKGARPVLRDCDIHAKVAVQSPHTCNHPLGKQLACGKKPAGKAPWGLSEDPGKTLERDTGPGIARHNVPHVASPCTPPSQTCQEQMEYGESFIPHVPPSRKL